MASVYTTVPPTASPHTDHVFVDGNYMPSLNLTIPVFPVETPQSAALQQVKAEGMYCSAWLTFGILGAALFAAGLCCGYLLQRGMQKFESKYYEAAAPTQRESAVLPYESGSSKV